MKVGIACSAGVDSQVLLHLALRQYPQCEFHILHFNHQLREASQVEESFMFNQAQALGLSCQIGSPHVAYLNGSLETWARNERYGFFQECIQQFELQEIWTAHHQDDQMETLWMRLERGTGIRGLLGIQEVRPFAEVYHPLNSKSSASDNCLIRRPLLDWSKQKILEYANSYHLSWHEDTSNQDLQYKRNFWRHQGRAMMAQAGRDLSEELLGQISQKLSQLWPSIQSDCASFYDHWELLLEQEPEFVALAVELNYPRHEAFEGGWTSGLASEVAKWFNHGVKPQFPLRNNWCLERQKKGLKLVNLDGSSQILMQNSQEVPEIPSESPHPPEKSGLDGRIHAVLNEKMYFLETQTIPSSQVEAFACSAFSTLLGLSDTETPLELRFRRPGDLFSPAPNKFSKRTLKKFMNEVGIPPSDRSSTLVVAQGNRILWIPQWGVSGLHQDQDSHTTRVKLKIVWQNKKNAEK